MKKHPASWIGETVLTLVGNELAPAIVVAVDSSGAEPPAVLAAVLTEHLTARTWLTPAPRSEVEQLGEGTYVERAKAIWP
jgi:hypothetical protein